MQTKKPCVCGRAYWPNQAWQHERCVATVVANVSAASVVANITIAEIANKKSRYRDPEKRRVYMRELMRKRRAAKIA